MAWLLLGTIPAAWALPAVEANAAPTTREFQHKTWERRHLARSEAGWKSALPGMQALRLTVLGEASALPCRQSRQGFIAQAPPPPAPEPFTGALPAKPLSSGTEHTTLQTGTQSTLLQTGTQSTMLRTGTQGAMIQAQVEREGGPVNVLFILDCSYSMAEKISGGDLKIEVAKKVLQDALLRIPNDVNVGLRVFGQQFNNDPLDCMQTALLVRIGRGNRRAIHRELAQLRATGLTPITYALKNAARDFDGLQGMRHVILITDGAETCGGDPCEYIAKLNTMGIKMRVDTIGFDLRREREAREQLNCISQASGGKYADAKTAGELIESVSSSVNKAISGRVLPKSQQSAPMTNTQTPYELFPSYPLKDLGR